MSLRVGSSRPALLSVLTGFVLAAGILGTGLLPGPVQAQESAPVQEQPPAPETAVALTQEQINETALRLTTKYMSPYCPGSNLRDCGSGKAAVLREEIRAWVAEGRTEEWITAELVSRYGESILSAPRFKGFNILVWIFPVIAVLVGLGVIFAYLQRQHRLALDTRTPVREVPNDGPADPALERALEDEVTARLR